MMNLRLLEDCPELTLGWSLGMGEHSMKAITSPAAGLAIANALAGVSCEV